MAEENKKPKTEEKKEQVTPKEQTVEQKSKPKQDTEKEEPKVEKQEDTKKEEPKKKKTDATVNGRSLRISTKHGIAVCNFIRNKDVDDAIKMLEQAEKKKIAIPMRGEIPHRKGMMSGRYPINAIKEFIVLLKSLKANALVNELELEKFKIACKANVASRPYRRFGRGRMKRTHVELKLIKKEKAKKKKRLLKKDAGKKNKK